MTAGDQAASLGSWPLVGFAPWGGFPRQWTLGGDGRNSRRRRRGRIWSPRAVLPPSVLYLIYANSGAGDPVNYSSPVASTSGLSWTTPPLTPGGSYRFAVRTQNLSTGLTEQNIDCTVAIVLDAAGNDVSARPAAPIGLRLTPIPGGLVRAEWSYLAAKASTNPEGFNVYSSSTSPLNYSAPTLSIPFNQGQTAYSTLINPPPSAATLYVGVRAFNAVAEEPNTFTTALTITTSGPVPVDNLSAAAS